MPANNPKVIDLFKPKPLSPATEIARLKAYIRAIDLIIEPVTFSSRETVFGKWGKKEVYDGFIPGSCLVNLMSKVQPMKLVGPKGIGRRWEPANKKPPVRDRLLSFVNLGIFGGNS